MYSVHSSFLLGIPSMSLPLKSSNGGIPPFARLVCRNSYRLHTIKEILSRHYISVTRRQATFLHIFGDHEAIRIITLVLLKAWLHLACPAPPHRKLVPYLEYLRRKKISIFLQPALSLTITGTHTSTSPQALVSEVFLPFAINGMRRTQPNERSASWHIQVPRAASSSPIVPSGRLLCHRSKLTHLGQFSFLVFSLPRGSTVPFDKPQNLL